MPGRFVRKGELLAHTVNLDRLTVRAVVSPEDVDLISRRTNRVDVRLAEGLEDIAPAKITRIVPAAENTMPSKALTSEGGGAVPLDPTDPEGRKAVQRMFTLDLTLPAPADFINAGGRVYIRFDHGTDPLGVQWWRSLCQLFLSRFNV